MTHEHLHSKSRKTGPSERNNTNGSGNTNTNANANEASGSRETGQEGGGVGGAVGESSHAACDRSTTSTTTTRTRTHSHSHSHSCHSHHRHHSTCSRGSSCSATSCSRALSLSSASTTGTHCHSHGCHSRVHHATGSHKYEFECRDLLSKCFPAKLFASFPSPKCAGGPASFSPPLSEFNTDEEYQRARANRKTKHSSVASGHSSHRSRSGHSSRLTTASTRIRSHSSHHQASTQPSQAHAHSGHSHGQVCSLQEPSSSGTANRACKHRVRSKSTSGSARHSHVASHLQASTSGYRAGPHSSHTSRKSRHLTAPSDAPVVRVSSASSLGSQRKHTLTLYEEDEEYAEEEAKRAQETGTETERQSKKKEAGYETDDDEENEQNSSIRRRKQKRREEEAAKRQLQDQVVRALLSRSAQALPEYATISKRKGSLGHVTRTDSVTPTQSSATPQSLAISTSIRSPPSSSRATKTTRGKYSASGGGSARPELTDEQHSFATTTYDDNEDNANEPPPLPPPPPPPQSEPPLPTSAFPLSSSLYSDSNGGVTQYSTSQMTAIHLNIYETVNLDAEHPSHNAHDSVCCYSPPPLPSSPPPPPPCPPQSGTDLSHMSHAASEMVMMPNAFTLKRGDKRKSSVTHERHNDADEKAQHTNDERADMVTSVSQYQVTQSSAHYNAESHSHSHGFSHRPAAQNLSLADSAMEAKDAGDKERSLDKHIMIVETMKRDNLITSKSLTREGGDERERGRRKTLERSPAKAVPAGQRSKSLERSTALQFKLVEIVTNDSRESSSASADGQNDTDSKETMHSMSPSQNPLVAAAEGATAAAACCCCYHCSCGDNLLGAGALAPEASGGGMSSLLTAHGHPFSGSFGGMSGLGGIGGGGNLFRKSRIANKTRQALYAKRAARGFGLGFGLGLSGTKVPLLPGGAVAAMGPVGTLGRRGTAVQACCTTHSLAEPALPIPLAPGVGPYAARSTSGTASPSPASLVLILATVCLLLRFSKPSAAMEVINGPVKMDLINWTWLSNILVPHNETNPLEVDFENGGHLRYDSKHL